MTPLQGWARQRCRNSCWPPDLARLIPRLPKFELEILSNKYITTSRDLSTSSTLDRLLTVFRHPTQPTEIIITPRMAKSKPENESKEERKARKAEKKAAKASDSGVSKPKTEKKDKKEKKQRVAIAEQALTEITNGESKKKAKKTESSSDDEEDEEMKSSSETENKTEKKGKMSLKDRPVGALVPFAHPLADEKVGKKVFKSVKKGTFPNSNHTA